MATNQVMYIGTGRRKTSTAKVILKPGTGKITVNKMPALDFFPYETLVQDLEQPLIETATREEFDVIVHVKGGGFTGQAGATRLGISKALLNASEDYRKPLRAKGLLTRDARIKERKKYGLRGARRAPQFSKR